MTDPWDLARYLEEHPDDHEQRWRLAKKLYASWEYRHALEHLSVLKNEWKRHLNVNRYLAATLYRLGRYEEAAKELREAIVQWPGEITLYEQLARVLEASGSRDEAATIWEEILELDHNHATAKSAAKRLHEKDEEGSGADLRIMDSDNGVQIESGLACPNCGAQNSEEFDLCWQCHAPLGSEAKHNPTPFPAPAPDKQLLPKEHLNLFAGFLTVGLITVSVYLSLKMLSARSDFVQNGPVTYDTLYNLDLALSRAVTGFGVALLWPALLIIGVQASRPEKEVSTAWLFVLGLFLASGCYLITWLPGGLAVTAIPAAALLSLVGLLLAMPLEHGRACVAWVIQFTLLLGCTPLLFGIMESRELGRFHDPYAAIGPVVGIAGKQDLPIHTGAPVAQNAVLPFETTVTWTGEDSAWFNQRASRVVCIIDYAPTEATNPPRLNVESQAGGLVASSDIELPGSRVHMYVRPGTPYIFSLDGPPNVRATIEIESLMDYEVESP